ncbi:MAG: CHAT domain-containing protein, partial [Candidatus Parabeggiatoa sp.]|nr:CHAT domain-containing protein [Candidatus Parabeggiatoa sp.]
FQALYHFANSRQIHLSTHGEFYEHSPIKSYLSLGKGHRLPLWTLNAIQTPANLGLLSAGESNLTGQNTEGLLTPIGIGPTILAAGARTVIGTLWAYNGVAALCFSYHFYQIADKNPELPWHHIAAQARQQLRQMSIVELDELQKCLLEKLGEDVCDDQIESRYHNAKRSESKQPFKALYYWGGFIVAGEVRRGSGRS